MHVVGGMSSKSAAAVFVLLVFVEVQFRAPPPPPSATRPEPLVSDPSSPSSTRNTRTPNRPPFRNSSYLSTEVRLGFTEHRRAAKVGWIDSGGMSWLATLSRSKWWVRTES
ncbi:hypothetical protein C8F04DRAFT_1091229 [Mycena alexandri]|uniref:Secreted protein n=1 Tax=Mycena alexandri TaxID=1745969 RepID=A0AAD6T3D7_9AGAR|nr:hypothetical protein C8F04DRAFT_1091229 [Mycena alexandri]